jgi:alkylmercury lyase-like protein
MPTAEEQTDVRVRTAVYQQVIAAGVPPTRAELAQLLALAPAEVGSALERLATARALVLQTESREILMANPFSAVPTPYAVRAGGRLYYGNCIWDALGIPAMLATPAAIETSCACCGEAMALEVQENLLPTTGVVHFAIPARRWWDDIVYN